MLVLTRKLRETIHIGDEITLTVLRVKGNTVRIGIEAPRSVRVVRGELEFKLEQEMSNSEASRDNEDSCGDNQEGEIQAPSRSAIDLPLKSSVLETGCYAL